MYKDLWFLETRNGEAESLGRSIFRCFGNLHTDLRGDWTSLHSCPQYISVPVDPHPGQHLLLFIS